MKNERMDGGMTEQQQRSNSNSRSNNKETSQVEVSSRWLKMGHKSHVRARYIGLDTHPTHLYAWGDQFAYQLSRLISGI